MSNNRDAVPLVKVTRSGVIECKHRGSIAVVRGSDLIDSVGDPYTFTPMRSTAKPFQVIPLLKNGGIETYNLQLEEIAVMVSSHNGELSQINVVRKILAKAGLDEATLKCGTHPPYFEWLIQQIYSETGCCYVKPIHNNCSGKHAGMLLLSKLLGASLDNYWYLEHPVQQMILIEVANNLEVNPKVLNVGIDGCGVPTYNINLVQLAKVYCKLGLATKSDDPQELAFVREAMKSEPFMVAGSDRLDTDLMLLGNFIAKSGSKGIFCIAIPHEQIGIAIKIESGSDEASECAAVELLRKMNFLADNLSSLEKYWHIPVLTCTQNVIGWYEPIF